MSINDTTTPIGIAKSRRKNHTCPIRDVIDRIGDSWSLLILSELDQSTTAGSFSRFNQLRRDVEGISPRMLASTLRHLERDGYITRHIVPNTPPSVEYMATPLGSSLCQQINKLASWAIENQDEIHNARQSYDKRPSVLLSRDKISTSSTPKA